MGGVMMEARACAVASLLSAKMQVASVEKVRDEAHWTRNRVSPAVTSMLVGCTVISAATGPRTSDALRVERMRDAKASLCVMPMWVLSMAPAFHLNVMVAMRTGCSSGRAGDIA